jgi:inhibitor of KinA
MRVFPLGDNAVTVEFGNEISLQLNERAIALSEHLETNPFPGFVETVPAYASTTVFYDPITVRRSFPEFETAFDAVSAVTDKISVQFPEDQDRGGRTVEIPVMFGGDNSLDLGELCKFSGLSTDEVSSIFLERTYHVYMIGFLPGFAYMGEVDKRIAIPRKSTPRTKVPTGSVAIGGKQTGVYPLESPGGWHIIGRTELKMFDPETEPTCALRPGDRVKFVRQ